MCDTAFRINQCYVLKNWKLKTNSLHELKVDSFFGSVRFRFILLYCDKFETYQPRYMSLVMAIISSIYRGSVR